MSENQTASLTPIQIFLEDKKRIEDAISILERLDDKELFFNRHKDTIQYLQGMLAGFNYLETRLDL